MTGITVKQDDLAALCLSRFTTSIDADGKRSRTIQSPCSTRRADVTAVTESPRCGAEDVIEEFP